jgi:hypothetical protein
MFEEIWDLLCLHSCMSMTIRDSNSAITRCALATIFAFLPPTMVTVLPTRRRLKAKHQAPFPPDVVTMIPSFGSRKLHRTHHLILKPLATQGTFRCDSKCDESSRYLRSKSRSTENKGLKPVAALGSYKGVACSDCYHPQGRRAVPRINATKWVRNPLMSTVIASILCVVTDTARLSSS